MKLLDDYFKLQKEIYEYFGYVEDWVIIPLEDSTEAYWCIVGGEEEVHFAKTETELQSQSGDYYVNEIYTQRFLPKWVYRADEYTMICVDTHVDGNKFLQVFSNDRERPGEV